MRCCEERVVAGIDQNVVHRSLVEDPENVYKLKGLDRDISLRY